MEAIRQKDVTGIAVLASRRLLVVRFDRMLIIRASILAERPLLRKLRERQPDLLVRDATPGDLPMLERVFPHSATKYAGRLQRGDECLLVMAGSSPIAMGWVVFDRSAPSELGCRIHLPEGACWGLDTFVLAEHRRRGAFMVLMHEMFAALKARGLTRLIAAVSHLNTISRASHERVGYRTAEVLDRFVLGGITRYRITCPGGERIWLKGKAGEPPVLRLNGGDSG